MEAEYFPQPGSILHISTMLFLPKKYAGTKDHYSVALPQVRPGTFLHTWRTIAQVEECKFVGRHMFVEYEHKYPEDGYRPLKRFVCAVGKKNNYEFDGRAHPVNYRLWQATRIFYDYGYQIRFSGHRQIVFRDCLGHGHLSFMREGDRKYVEPEFQQKKARQKKDAWSNYRYRVGPRRTSLQEADDIWDYNREYPRESDDTDARE